MFKQSKNLEPSLTPTTSILLHHVRSNSDIANAVALSGNAALLLDGGRIFHFAFSIPLEINEGSVYAIESHSEQGRLLRRCKLIVWDESSISRKNNNIEIDRTFRDVLREVIFDRFCQWLELRQDLEWLLNVSTDRAFGVNAQNMNNTTLASELQAFATYLLNVVDRNMDGFHFRGSNSAPAADTHILPLLGSEVDLFSRAWSDMLSHSVFMTPLTADVKILNNIMLQQVLGNEVACRSVDRGLTDISQVQYSVKIFNNIEVGCLPSHVLKLKVHSPIMLLRNLSPAFGLCNGTRLIIRNLLPNVIHAKVISGSKVDKDVLIP
ncbi:conserved hypothetical protein [Mucor ambiguus]|uniref:ATP-dependent DNA helicase n=1 Tax=Mucor ambiguus TaxID=91626 RepID=A0A0C9M1D9_9FUNG|nr:conserved hypothetical protein [Mucor ambiguus]